MEKEHRSIWMYLYDLQFRQAWIDVGGVRTRYIEAGDPVKPAVVMVHGLGGSWENFFGNVRAHAEHFHVYAFDMLGHGLTDKPDHPLEAMDYAKHLRGFLDATGIARASLIGLSLGSWTCTRFTTLWPERVASVTMASAWGRPQAVHESRDVQESREMLARQRETRLKSVINPTWEAMQKIFEGLIAKAENRIPDLLGIRQAFYRRPEMKKGMENIFAGIDPEPWGRNMLRDEELRKIDKPFLVVATPDHKDVFLQSSYEYAKLVPNARLAELTEASHWPQWERVDEFNKLSVEFLQEIHGR